MLWQGQVAICCPGGPTASFSLQEEITTCNEQLQGIVEVVSIIMEQTLWTQHLPVQSTAGTLLTCAGYTAIGGNQISQRKKSKSSHKHWDKHLLDYLSEFCFAPNTAVNKSNGVIPVKLNLGQAQRLPYYSPVMPHLTYQTTKQPPNFRTSLYWPI